MFGWIGKKNPSRWRNTPRVRWIDFTHFFCLLTIGLSVRHFTFMVEHWLSLDFIVKIRWQLKKKGRFSLPYHSNCSTQKMQSLIITDALTLLVCACMIYISESHST